MNTYYISSLGKRKSRRLRLQRLATFSLRMTIVSLAFGVSIYSLKADTQPKTDISELAIYNTQK